MKISELIHALESAKRVIGDVEVIVKDDVGSDTSFDADDLYVDATDDNTVRLLIDA